jgi:hypothetical protein
MTVLASAHRKEDRNLRVRRARRVLRMLFCGLMRPMVPMEVHASCELLPMACCAAVEKHPSIGKGWSPPLDRD